MAILRALLSRVMRELSTIVQRLEIYLYPADLLLRGAPHAVAHVPR
ncbi:MAG: hypothetical protein ABSF69_13150 [Polyangiaceae bacterium]